jgi:hypothetical protein
MEQIALRGVAHAGYKQVNLEVSHCITAQFLDVVGSRYVLLNVCPGMREAAFKR